MLKQVATSIMGERKGGGSTRRGCFINISNRLSRCPHRQPFLAGYSATDLLCCRWKTGAEGQGSDHESGPGFRSRMKHSGAVDVFTIQEAMDIHTILHACYRGRLRGINIWDGS